MSIDFSPIHNNEIKLLEFSKSFSLNDLKAATNESIDFMRGVLQGMSDAQVIFLPFDPEADDPHAVPGEEKIGWSLAHLVVHVTASSEEWAAYSSILARGIVYTPEPRLRYETSWHEVTTYDQCIQRLEESRRIRLSYLDTWPDKPHLDTLRQVSPRYAERFGDFNATAALLFGLMHETGHRDQFREAARQAREAFASV